MPSSALNGSAKGKEIPGSKIFISGLPFDVGEKEIEVWASPLSQL